MTASGHIYPPSVWVKHQGSWPLGTCVRCGIPIPPAGPQGRAGYWTRGEESRETAPLRPLDVPCFPGAPTYRSWEASQPPCEWQYLDEKTRAVLVCGALSRILWNHQNGTGSPGYYCPAHAVRMAEITLEIMRGAVRRFEPAG